MCVALSIGAQRHLLAAAAAGQQADADFDQSGSTARREAGERAACRVISVPPPRLMPNGATTTGLGENLMACVMFWN